MPIYEFYCSECHRIFKFLARKIETEKVPGCPRCGKRRLERQVSLFAFSTGRKEEGADVLPPDLDVDPGKLERVMEDFSREAEGLDEEDPRKMGGMLRKFYNTMGLKMGPTMEEALQRMEAGEDSDAIEAELGDALAKEDPFSGEFPRDVKTIRKKLLPPSVDDTLYDL